MRIGTDRGPLRALRWMLPALLLGACATTGTAPPAAPLDALGARVLTGYIQPHTRALLAGTEQLRDSTLALCNRPADAEARARVEARFAAVVAAWAGVEFLRFGPLVEHNRLEQFFFWPDPRGVMQRQLRAVLAAADPALLSPAGLQAQSVAVAGLPALEYLLYADDATRVIGAGDAAGRYRCAHAAAIAANLARLAGEIDAEWRGNGAFATEFARPGPGNHIYRSGNEVATEVLKALATALHVARDQKLAPALGEDVAGARGTLLPLYRSGLTAHYLAAGAAALADFHVAGRFADALGSDTRWTDASLRDELHRVQQDFQSLQMPVDRAISDAAERDIVVHAALLLTNARAIVEEFLAPALGVNLGFNALDGD